MGYLRRFLCCLTRGCEQQHKQFFGLRVRDGRRRDPENDEVGSATQGESKQSFQTNRKKEINECSKNSFVRGIKNKNPLRSVLYCLVLFLLLHNWFCRRSTSTSLFLFLICFDLVKFEAEARLSFKS